MVCGINNVGRDRVTQCCHCVEPSRIEAPPRELWHVLDNDQGLPVILRAAHHGPCGTTLLIVVRAIFPTCMCMTLAAWRRKHCVMIRKACPIGLMEVLAYMYCTWMIDRMKVDSDGAMVSTPDNLDACGPRTFGKSASSGE